MKSKNKYDSIYFNEICMDCKTEGYTNVIMTLEDIMNDKSEPCDKHKGDYNG